MDILTVFVVKRICDNKVIAVTKSEKSAKEWCDLALDGNNNKICDYEKFAAKDKPDEEIIIE